MSTAQSDVNRTNSLHKFKLFRENTIVVPWSCARMIWTSWITASLVWRLDSGWVVFLFHCLSLLDRGPHRTLRECQGVRPPHNIETDWVKSVFKWSKLNQIYDTIDDQIESKKTLNTFWNSHFVFVELAQILGHSCTKAGHSVTVAKVKSNK